MNENHLQKIFITGADKGLGLSLATRFLYAGYIVFAGIYQTAENFAVIGQEYGPNLVCILLDVTDMKSVIAASHSVSTQTQAIDILINNAAVYLHSKPDKSLQELDLTDGHMEGTFNVNSFGPLRVTQQFLPLLENGNGKLIINISSEAGSIGNCWRATEFAYCMSKAALNMQSRILQNMLAPQGFRVLAIHPGWMRTDMGGPDADIHPDEAAEAIFQLALMQTLVSNRIYMDYQGKPLPW